MSSRGRGAWREKGGWRGRSNASSSSQAARTHNTRRDGLYARTSSRSASQQSSGPVRRASHQTASSESGSSATPARSARPLTEPLGSIRSGPPTTRTGDASQIGKDDDSLDEVVMAIEMKRKGPLGCCYYVAREEALYFMEEIHLGSTETFNQRTQVVSTR